MAVNLHKVSGRRVLGTALTLCTVVIWGSMSIVLKGVLGGLDPITLTWTRFTIIAILMAAFLAWRGGYRLLLSLRGTALLLLCLAIVGLCANYVLFVIALKVLSPSSAQVLIQLSYIFLLCGGLIVFKESFSLRQWLGVGVLFAGLLLFFNQRYDEMFSLQGTLSKSILIMLGSAAMWTVYALAQKQLLRYLSPEPVMFAVGLGSALLLLPAATPSALSELDLVRTLLLVVSASATLVAYITFARALDHLEATRVSMVVAIMPLVTVGGMATWARLAPELFTYEQLNGLSMLGAGLVVVGSALSSWGKS